MIQPNYNSFSRCLLKQKNMPLKTLVEWPLKTFKPESQEQIEYRRLFGAEPSATGARGEGAKDLFKINNKIILNCKLSRGGYSETIWAKVTTHAWYFDNLQQS